MKFYFFHRVSAPCFLTSLRHFTRGLTVAVASRRKHSESLFGSSTRSDTGPFHPHPTAQHKNYGYEAVLTYVAEEPEYQ